VVLREGDTIIEDVLLPSLHKNELAPLAEMVTLSPSHIVVSVEEIRSGTSMKLIVN
jgi:hypothetical protein